MATSRLSAPSCLPTAPCEPSEPSSFLRTNAAVNRNKKATYFIYVSKVRWKERRKEGAGRITLSVGWYHSIHADQFSQTEADEKGASTRRREGGREGRRAEMVVVLICQRNTVLHVLLKCSHKPELSEVGRHILTFCQVWIVDFLLGLAVHRLIHQLHVGTSNVAPLYSNLCGTLCIQVPSVL